MYTMKYQILNLDDILNENLSEILRSRRTKTLPRPWSKFKIISSTRRTGKWSSRILLDLAWANREVERALALNEIFHTKWDMHVRAFTQLCIPSLKTIKKISVYKHCFCCSNMPTTRTKDPLFQQPMRLWLAH